ncbi:SWIM zinc finger family protein [Halalkalirubrum salinum]|uniref:SWIM zinc finger family protein n=1 Tax=Halalkalirubrum salinum TaxID=2563889 RepID=UPI0010FB43D6|nr:SWIM zinc finger family protein [Halalkalirubrum salinum]
MVDPNPILTEAAVRDLAHSQSYDRGENYYDKGAVVELVRRGETIRAAVEGSQYEPYQVRIELDETGVVDTACSCPYDHGGICKHRVAVLLTYVRDPDRIDQRPPVSELVADADPEDLRGVLVDLVESRPELAERVESRLETVRSEEADDDARDRTPDINRESIRQQVQYILRPTEGRSVHAYDPYEAVETDVEKLRNLLDQAGTAVEAGDGETALNILEPLANELMNEEWLALSYDDSNAIFEFFDEVDRVLAEALLTADLSEAERADWEDRLWTWEQEMGSYTHHPPYSIALEAAQRGWDFEPVQRAMQGDIGYADLWEGDPPWYAEDFIRVRLDVLERQDRIEEYLNLAEAADLIDDYVTMLVEEGRIDEAIKYGRRNLYSPDEALALAKALRKHDRPEAALEIAQHGLRLDDSSGKAELAEWLRDRAVSLGESEVALEAAIAAFDASPTLAAYQAAEELAGEDWPDVREELLKSLVDKNTRQRVAPRHVEIFLYAERYDEAITIANRFSDYKVVEPVVEAVWEEHPHWTIDACKEQAEPIIEEGQSQRYRHAVRWLEYAGKAARVSGQLDEWCAYVEELRNEHYQKYKLRPMLDDLLEDFSC